MLDQTEISELLVHSYVEVKDYDKAIELYKKMISKYPDRYIALF